MFDRITNKAVASKLGCMTSVNIWQDTVIFDELTINERQKKDQAFSSMLDEVRRGCPSPQTIQALQDRVIEVPVVDKFEALLASKQSPLCLFPTRKACQEFNSKMLSRLEAEVIEVPCIDEVDETVSTFKWSKKATEEMKKLNSDCNLTAGLQAVVQLAVGARVMLRRNIDTNIGLVNGAVGTVVSIRAHHIAVKFDNVSEPYRVEKVKSKFMVMKKIFVYRKQFPLILAFAVTIHKCQGLSLDCAMMELSDQVFSPGMAYVALSRVKQLENLHLIAFKPQSVMVSSKCLQEVNRLRQTYRPDLPQYSVPTTQGGTQKRKRKMEGACTSEPSNPPKLKRIRTDTGSRKRKAASQTVDKKLPLKKTCPDRTKSHKPKRNPEKLISCPTPNNPLRIIDRFRFNPVSEEWQRRVCQELGLRFVCANACDEGGPNVKLKHPTFGHRIIGDGNCLFRAFSYIITGAEDQHFELRCRIVERLRSVGHRLLVVDIHEPTVQQYIANSRVDRQGAWGTWVEMMVLANMVGANVYSYRIQNDYYEIASPGYIDPAAYPQDYGRQSMYILYTGNHFNVVLSQEPATTV